MIARDENNLITGSVGDIGCWSFQSAKQLTCGDGGILTTNNAILKKNEKIFEFGIQSFKCKSNKIVVTKDQRQNPNYKRFDEIGFNYRMNEFSAAYCLLAQCEKVKFFVQKRRKAALSLTNILKNNNYLIPQKISKNAYSTYYTLAVKLMKNSKKKIELV